jgi:hypothetical protein
MSAERQQYSPWKRFGKWSGAWLGTLAWIADQQIVSMTAYANCPPRSRALAVGVGLACAVLALIGGLHSWGIWRVFPARNAGDHTRTDRFIAALSMLLAAISILAIAFGTIAGVILRCER